MKDLRCLIGLHAFQPLQGGVTFDGEPSASGVALCSRAGCDADRINTLALAFLQLELNARVVGSDEPYVRMTPEFAAWLKTAKDKHPSDA